MVCPPRAIVFVCVSESMCLYLLYGRMAIFWSINIYYIFFDVVFVKGFCRCVHIPKDICLFCIVHAAWIVVVAIDVAVDIYIFFSFLAMCLLFTLHCLSRRRIVDIIIILFIKVVRTNIYQLEVKSKPKPKPNNIGAANVENSIKIGKRRSKQR